MISSQPLRLTLLGLATTLLLLVSGPARAQTCDCAPTQNSCNRVKSQTVLPPDRAATVYVTLNSTCAAGGICIKGCSPQFNITNAGLTTSQKCQALVDAITNDAVCKAAGYVIQANNCAFGQTFTVADTLHPNSVLALGISNNSSIFSQTGQGQILPDYEAELITPACTDPDGVLGNGNDQVHQVTFKGNALGQAITGAQSNVQIIADLRPRGGGIVTAQIPTSPGMSPATLANRLVDSLRSQNVDCAVFGGRSVRCAQPREGAPIGFAGGTNDLGVALGSNAGSRDKLPVPDANAVPALADWALMLLILSVGSGGFLLLRSRRRVGASA